MAQAKSFVFLQYKTQLIGMLGTHLVQTETYARTGCHKFVHGGVTVAGYLQEFLADKAGYGAFFFFRQTVIENTYFQGEFNQVLNDIVKRHQFMIGLKVFRPPDNAEHKSHTPDIGFHNKRVGVTLCHQPLYTGESLSGSYKSGLGIRPGWEVVINGHLGHPFKSAESEFRIGRCEEPERPGPQAVPGP